jgi:ribonuclease HI
MRLIIFSDGACRGNPGPASIGVVLRNEIGQTIQEIHKTIGISTNNKAEYQAVIEGLTVALQRNADEVELMLDSELVVKQLTGEYRVKNTELKELHRKVVKLLLKFSKRSVNYIDRSQNQRADRLANWALDHQ